MKTISNHCAQGFFLWTAIAAMLVGSDIWAASPKMHGAYLGVSITKLSRSDKEKSGVSFGAKVTGVQKDSPAEKAGIQEEDVIQYFGGEKIRTPADLMACVREAKPDTNVSIRLVRNAIVKELMVKTGQSDPNRKFLITKTTSRVRLGVRLHAMGDDLAPYFKVKPDEGALILEVEGKSPAEKAGLKSGDVIVRIGKDKVYEPGDVSELIKDCKPGDKVDIAVIRQGREISFTAELEAHEFMKFNGLEMPCLPQRLGDFVPECNIQIKKEFEDVDSTGVGGWNEKLNERMKEIQIRCKEINEKMQSKAEDIQKHLEMHLNVTDEHATI
jgi:S1-C subfamily serine protease